MSSRSERFAGTPTRTDDAPPAGSVRSVLMVIESVFPAPKGGGAESQVRTLCREYVRRGVAVSVLAPMVREGSRQRTDRVDGVPVYRIPYPKLRWIGGLWMLVSLVTWLIAERRTYDAIHAHIAGNMSGVCCVVGRLLGKPVVVKLTGMFEVQSGMLSSTPSAVQRLRSAALRQATAYQAISLRIARSLGERGFDAGRVAYIPNAVDVQRFEQHRGDPELRRRYCGGRARVGVFVGRLAAEKGLEHLVDGWAAALRDRQDTMLLIVGEGPEHEALQRHAEGLGIGAQVVFAGPSEQVERFMAIADFGVLTSLHEGLSNTLLEYMASGLPVLGTRVSGTEDFVVDGRSGWLVPPADADAIADALRQVVSLSDADLRRLGDGARALVRERASVAPVVDRLASIFETARAPRDALTR